MLQQYPGRGVGPVEPSVGGQSSHAYLSKQVIQNHPLQPDMFPASEMLSSAQVGFQMPQDHPVMSVPGPMAVDPRPTAIPYTVMPQEQSATVLLNAPLQNQLEHGLTQTMGPSSDMGIHPMVQPVLPGQTAFGVPDLLPVGQFVVRPDMLEQYLAVGNVCREIGRLDLAASTFRACMTISPDSMEARAAYNACYYSQSFFEPSMEIGTVFPEDTFNDVGNALRSLGHTSEAECAYRAALKIAPRHAHAWNNLGNAMRAKGQIMEAMQCYTSSLTSQPGFAAAHCNLAGLLRDQGKPQEAEAQYRAAIMSSPNLPEAAAGLGTALRDMGRTEEAVSFYVRAVSLQPGAADHHANLANTYKDLNRIEESIMSYQAALCLQPDLPDAFCNMVHSLSVICDWRQREQNFATLLAIVDRQLDTLLHHPATNPRLYSALAGALPNSTPQLVDVCGGSRSERDGASVSASTTRDEDCTERTPRRKFIHHPSSPTVVRKARMRGEFAKFMTNSPAVVAPVLASGLPSVQPFHALIYPMSPEKFRALSAAYATRAESMVAGILQVRQKWTVPKGSRPRLKVGYVSSDYNNHPYSHLTQSIYGLHGNGGNVECYCYALTASDQSAWRLRIERESEHFRDISNMSAKQSAETIANDGIHVLVNCNGYTKGARTELFALRPAPVQVSFMGFPGTLGAHYIEYFITDTVTSPPEMASRMHSEALLYHPHSYFVNDHRQTSIPGPAAHPSGRLTRAHYGLPEDCFLFLMHNQLYKLSPDTFDVWARILKRVPGSKLWLLRFPPSGERRIRAEAAARGLGPERLIFTDVAGKEEHVARAGLGDLFLDTPTCNAHTIGTDVLWSGVPMITCPGSLFASRVAASLLTAAGVPELIASDMNAYEDLAVDLATNRPKLQAIRARIENSRSSNPLFDTARWVRNVEGLYWGAWKNFQAGNAPTHIFGKDVYDGTTMGQRPALVESHYSTTDSRISESLLPSYGRFYSSTVAT
ncbi:UDP-GlcNAc: peptide-N-acetylglucosaminyltransferase, family GT41 [Chondrus crispus]|uniref:protein O-GlcNAc transferase n=1 Tax=Chondrus crispus TaxID=2769 RepID=R7QBT1_CHOCR|nr:UDP-GlcNAc: peptide-N-acetylglucosaminyltransferase, family GT41 [Chondrus crispus]CDF35957.1 UDP-GlcNAc: peptide-N-acetylglucosaminyltransferase, family GT41 [Chondrus crispus]|eukprot:XP_005715776.1 UDP-GlcNAc: peptide-N-acetylglucosaminyltransferase, family GT41 [Chondrus crispus]